MQLIPCQTLCHFQDIMRTYQVLSSRETGYLPSLLIATKRLSAQLKSLDNQISIFFCCQIQILDLKNL